MCNENEWIVREAFLAYDRGDIARMMDFVDPDLEWTYVDPSAADPQRRGTGPHRGRRRGHVEGATRQPLGRGARRPARHPGSRVPR